LETETLPRPIIEHITVALVLLYC